MNKSYEVVVKEFLDDIDAVTAIVPTTKISALSLDREVALPAIVYREVGHIPQMTLSGDSGLALHSYSITILSHDPDEAALVLRALKSRFRVGGVTNIWPFKPTGWTSGEAYLEGGELRDGSTEQSPEIVSDRDVVMKNMTLDLWFQE
jgi:hypothetical protein